jgi:thioredoxin-dependent peroxiredoxin
MTNALLTFFSIIGALTSVPASAALKPGAIAPSLVAPAALGGKAFEYSLARARKLGPVVIYFFPAAFTSGCTLETREFVEKYAAFRAAGATVIGVSTDDIGTLKRFSIEECRGKFPVVAANAVILSAFDAKLPFGSQSNRISYVVAPSGQIVYAHSDLDYREHVARTLRAVQNLRKAKR